IDDPLGDLNYIDCAVDRDIAARKRHHDVVQQFLRGADTGCYRSPFGAGDRLALFVVIVSDPQHDSCDGCCAHHKATLEPPIQSDQPNYPIEATAITCCPFGRRFGFLAQPDGLLEPATLKVPAAVGVLLKLLPFVRPTPFLLEPS